MFQTLKMIPPKVWFVDGEVLGVLGCSLAGLLWMLLPFFESDKAPRTKVWISGLSIFALVYVVGMTIYGFIAN
jgi:quinol-cytochrome oxidoreductase complex cytochrome b subunit